MPCTITIDGKSVKAKRGSNLLWVALDNGFYIPNLCSIKGQQKPAASCRLCYVEVAGKEQPVTACTEKTHDGMAVRLNTPAASALRRTAFELLLSNHDLDCAHCVKHRRCELQAIAKAGRLSLHSRRLARVDQSLEIDNSHPLITFNPNKCVLCGRCVWICREKGSGILDFAFRGIRTRISTFAGKPLAATECNSCLSCVEVCPVGALYQKPVECKI